MAQAFAETKVLTKFKESLNYTKQTFVTAENVYKISPTAINAGFVRLGMSNYTHQQKLDYIYNHLMDNDEAYGKHLYGSDDYLLNIV